MTDSSKARESDEYKLRQAVFDSTEPVAPTPSHSGEYAELAARAVMLDDGCGLTIDGERVFCDDPRALESPHQNCTCKRLAKIALDAAVPALVRERDAMREALEEVERRKPGVFLFVAAALAARVTDGSEGGAK